MKFVLAIAAAAIASVAAYDEVTECPFDEIVKLAPLAVGTNFDMLQKCQAASGDAQGDNQWQMLPPSGYPTDAQRAGMCGEEACFGLINALLELGPGDCMLTIGDTSINTKKLAEEFTPSCFA